jgi:carboxymethylenebutenolidase
VKHDSTVYPGAPHSFFDRKFAEFADASADSWKRVQAFVGQNTKR